jgi:hypothetical protein
MTIDEWLGPIGAGDRADPPLTRQGAVVSRRPEMVSRDGGKASLDELM